MPDVVTDFLKFSLKTRDFDGWSLSHLILNIFMGYNFSSTGCFTKQGKYEQITNEDIQKMVSRIAKEEYIKMVNKNIDIGKYVIPRTLYLL